MYIISYINHIVSYRILSYSIITYHIISYIISYIMSYATPYIISYHIISYIVYHISYRIVSYHISYRIVSYHISYIIPYHISYHVQYPHSCKILIKFEFSRQIFEKYSSIKFHENSSSESPVLPRGLTDRQIHDEAGTRFSQCCSRA